MTFQKDFLWASASAAYQIEGAALTNGKGPSIWDIYSHVEGNTFKNTTGDVAIDFYHRFLEDIQLMKEQGLQAYRFSIAWSRVLPTGTGNRNEEGIAFYHTVIDTLLAHGIEPIVTIYHWDLPNALQEAYEGWLGREVVDDFHAYATLLFEEYGSKVNYWVTMNEQNIFTSLGYLQKLHPPKMNDFQAFLRANHHANLANAKTIKTYRAMGFHGKIGPSFAYSPAYAKSCAPEDVLAMEDALELENWFWMDTYVNGAYPILAVRKIEQMGYHIPMMEGDAEILQDSRPDFMGVNYYQTTTIAKEVEASIKPSGNTVQSTAQRPTDTWYRVSDNPYVQKTDWNWMIDPSGLRIALRRITSRYQLPTLISENGLGAYDTLEADGSVHDPYRIAFLKAHIEAMEAAIADGCEVLGYCTWSFQDLFSWLNGYAKRYGFVYVDRDEENERELKRYKKDSFYWYQRVIATNGQER
ncbi:MAG: glycoside hydrolase family 1 protein [Erysipelotrichaceae bacterium]